MYIKKLYLVPWLAGVFVAMLPGPASAQSFKTLHSFGATFNTTNSDGAYPAGLIIAGDTLYGTATGGCIPGDGSVFAIKTNGTGFTNLHTFTG